VAALKLRFKEASGSNGSNRGAGSSWADDCTRRESSPSEPDAAEWGLQEAGHFPFGGLGLDRVQLQRVLADPGDDTDQVIGQSGEQLVGVRDRTTSRRRGELPRAGGHLS
jgi:hypothetical protein